MTPAFSRSIAITTSSPRPHIRGRIDQQLGSGDFLRNSSRKGSADDKEADPDFAQVPTEPAARAFVSADNVDEAKATPEAIASKARRRRAMDKIRSLHDGDLGVLDAVDCGPAAIPALRALLFEREPSGLYEVRRRAVDALAALGAHDVLMDFLGTYHDVTDPIERLGEDAVINAAALALVPAKEPDVFRLLLGIGRSC